MKLKKILEEYLDTIKTETSYGKLINVEVFTNPSKKEFEEVAETIFNKKYVRFLTDKRKKKLYIFPPSIIHHDIARQLGLKLKSPNVVFWGVVKKVSKEWKIVENEVSFVDKKYNEKDWPWADRYINATEYLKKITEEKNRRNK